MCCFDVWWNQEKLDLLLWVRSPRQITLLIMGTRHRPCLSLSDGFQFPDSLWSYSNKPIIFTLPPCGRQGHLTLLILQSLPPRPWLFILLLSTPLMWPYRATYMTNELLPMSSIHRQVPHVQSPQGRNSFLANRMNRRQLNWRSS